MIRLWLYREIPHRRGEGGGDHVTHPSDVSAVPASLDDPHHRAQARAQLRRELKCIRNAVTFDRAVRTAAQLPSKAATGATSTSASIKARRSATSTANATRRAASHRRITSWTHGRASSPVPTIHQQIQEWKQQRPRRRPSLLPHPCSLTETPGTTEASLSRNQPHPRTHRSPFRPSRTAPPSNSPSSTSSRHSPRISSTPSAPASFSTACRSHLRMRRASSFAPSPTPTTASPSPRRTTAGT
jgi:hypothetical protein